MLTKRQQQVLDYLHEHQREHGLMPSTREIQRHFGFASQTAAMGLLQALEKKGAIRRLARMARAVIFPEDIDKPETVDIPVYGAIPAGFASDNPEDISGRITLDTQSLGLQRNTKPFALRVRGDSMTGAHICDGDHVILVKREPKPRDVVAALIDGETTLKRFIVEQGKPFLRAENPRYPDLIPARELLIQGVMVGLFRSNSSPCA